MDFEKLDRVVRMLDYATAGEVALILMNEGLTVGRAFIIIKAAETYRRLN